MSFLLRVPGELLAEMRAYAKLREKELVNSAIWDALTEWTASQPRADRTAAARLRRASGEGEVRNANEGRLVKVWAIRTS